MGDNNETNVDVTLQEDQFSNGSDWSDEEEENDQENCPPPSSYVSNKESNLRQPNLAPITEESRSVHYSRFSQQHTDDKDSDEMTQRTQAPTPAAAAARETSKRSISFGSESFGKLEDLDKVLKQEEDDCHERNRLRPRPDVTHESKIHSWEPTPASLNISKISLPQTSFSKPYTSTPKSGRFPGKFDAGVSEIQNMSQMSYQPQTEASTLSTTRINCLIKDVAMADSSLRNARNFVQKAPPARPVPKTSILLDNLKRESSIRTSSKINAPQDKPKSSFLPPPSSLPQIVERDSLASRPSTSANDGVEIAIKPEPLSHWGCVALGEEVQSKIYVKNITTHILEVMPKLSNRINAFKIASPSAVQIQPNCSHEFIVIFSPTECKLYHRNIKFQVASSGKTYSHALFGYGGTSDVKIVEKRSLAYFPRSGVYRFSPTNIYAFGFDIENNGERSAFVQIVPYDVNGNIARNITVEPNTFGLVPNDSTTSKIRITVKVPEDYLQQMTRMSIDSVRTTASTAHTKNTIFSLKVYFGVERLRQRAKKYCDDIHKHETFHGLSLTRTSFCMNSREINALDDYAVSFQDMELLKTQTRVLTLLIGDDRIGPSGNYSLPSSRPMSSFSNHHYRAGTHPLESGYYIPDVENDADATLMSVAHSDRTTMK